MEPEPATSSKSSSSSSLRRVQPLGDRVEVGEHATEPAVVDVGHADARRLLGDGLLGLLLRADEEDGAAVGDRLLDELVGVVDVRQRLLQVDDVDAVALGHDEALHLRVPATGLVPEVDAALEELAHGDDGHAVVSLLSFQLSTRRAGLPFSCLAPATCATRKAPGLRVTRPVAAVAPGGDREMTVGRRANSCNPVPIAREADCTCRHGTASLPGMGNPLVSRMQGFGTTIFAEMSGARRETGAINLGQGFPDTDGPARDARRGRRGDRRRPQPVPARAGRARSCARPWPRTSSASTGSTSTRDRRCS